MACHNREIELLLAEFVSGHLGEQDAMAVRSHVHECDSCRKTLELMKHQRIETEQPAPEIESPHISAEILSLYDRAPGTLSDEMRTAVQAHLRECDQCQSALEFVSGFDAELVGTQPSEVTEVISVRRPLYRIIAELAIAAALVLLIAGSERFSSTHHLAHDWVLHELHRGGADLTTVMRSSPSADISFSMRYPHKRGEFDYAVVLVNESTGQPIQAIQHLEFPSPEYVRVSLSTAPLADGEYALELREVSRSAAPDTVTRLYPFRLTTRSTD